MCFSAQETDLTQLLKIHSDTVARLDVAQKVRTYESTWLVGGAICTYAAFH